MQYTAKVINAKPPHKHPRKVKQQVKELLLRSREQARQRRLDWLRRPIFRPALFVDLRPDAAVPRWVAAKRVRKHREVAKLLGSDERLAVFKEFVVAYRKDPSIQNYVRIRHEFPKLEILVAHFTPAEMMIPRKEFIKQGIDPLLVVRALGGEEPSIDALCLRLLELLIARSNLPKTGPGYIEKRRNSISDATIDYLVVKMLEALDAAGKLVRIPASLVVLTRELLGGPNADLHRYIFQKKKFYNAASAAAKIFDQGNERISVRKLAAVAGVSRSTAARLLDDEEFRLSLESYRKFLGKNIFPTHYEWP
jgi:hypothetical protein